MTQTNPNNRRIFTSTSPDTHRELAAIHVRFGVTRDEVYELALNFAARSDAFRQFVDKYTEYKAETGDGQTYINQAETGC